MELQSLTAISPIDGRYRAKLAGLSDYFSELAFIRYKVRVEIEYFIALCQSGIPALRGVSADLFEPMRDLYRGFRLEDGQRVKEIEAVTNHDVKAVEYFIKERFDALDPSLKAAKEYVHFGLTSQDINNSAFPMMLRDALQNEVINGYDAVIGKLQEFVAEWSGIAMLARTHGQPASPTTLSKEIRVYVARLDRQMEILRGLPYYGKFGGATGNMNAHYVAFPETDWHEFAADFLADQLELERAYPTTQISHYDNLSVVFDNLKRLNTILLDLCIDVWLYVSMEYFGQKTVAHEVGSSAMPHKVNPIDFENAEGNLGIANALLDHLSRKLPVSRLQRDLTDSTVLRNVGVAVSHSFLALLSLEKGLDKLTVNRARIAVDLENNWAVVAEALQTILRRENYPNPYETLKDLTRGKGKVDAATMRAFIDGLDVSEAVKQEMRAISPSNYIGAE
ncbi:MAG: adenylosuccinate lyase [Bacteroidota bacterium]